jgi:hypothetical protein
VDVTRNFAFSAGLSLLSTSRGGPHSTVKKGDPLECCNYRGITVGVALAKLYAIVLNKRLSDWTEKYHRRAKAQAGFRKDYRCADNLFILRTLLEKSKSHQIVLLFCGFFLSI